MRIASFYGDAFEGQFALRLKDSARAFEMECDLYQETKPGGLRERGRMRTKTLLRCLAEHPGEDVLFVEADAQLHRRPDILLDEKDFEIGIYYDTGTLAISGPVFVRNSPRVVPLIREWRALNHAFPENSELENLSQVLSRPGFGLEIRRFPVTYAWVERVHRASHPQARPVIYHYQTNGHRTRRIGIPQ